MEAFLPYGLVAFSVLVAIALATLIMAIFMLHTIRKVEKQQDQMYTLVRDYLHMIVEEDERALKEQQDQEMRQRAQEETRLISSVIQEIFS